MAVERLNILFSSWNFPPRRGGIEEMVRQLSAHLSRRDDVAVLTSWARSSAASEPRVHRSPWRGLLGYLTWLVGRLPREARARPETVLLSSGALVGSWVELLNWRSRRPHVVLAFGTDVTYPNRLYQWWLRRLLPRASVLVAISRSTRHEVIRRGFSEPERVRVLPPGVDPGMTSLAAADMPETPSDVVLWVGRVIPRKGLRPFLEHCWPQILARKSAELWVIGGEADSSLAHESGELAATRQWLQGRPEAGTVRFLGEVADDELRGALRRAKLLVLPAVPVEGDVEGFGIVFLEAALFGVPAVSTRLGGIPDAVIDGETGLLVDPGDWPAFADAVVHLLDDAPTRSRLSEGGRRRATGELSWSTLAVRYREILLGAMRERGSGAFGDG